MRALNISAPFNWSDFSCIMHDRFSIVVRQSAELGNLWQKNMHINFAFKTKQYYHIRRDGHFSVHDDVGDDLVARRAGEGARVAFVFATGHHLVNPIQRRTADRRRFPLRAGLSDH